MKKFLSAILLSGVLIVPAFSMTTLRVQNVYYNPQTATWSDKSQSDKDIHLSNKRFVGSGGFSEYYDDNGKLIIGPMTNVEFVSNGKLIGINSHDLKFYKYTYNTDGIRPDVLDISEIQSLYPDYEIVKISDFENNKITLYKEAFKKKNFLILNDTPLSFYKYNYKPSKVNPSYVKTFITVSHPGKIVFSHYGDDTVEAPALKIRVKNKFKD